MNKKFTLSACAALIFFANSVSASEKVSGGTIYFTGTVTDATCTINGGNSADLSIMLKPITVQQASQSGLIEDGKEAFSLEFSDCSASNKSEEGAATLNVHFASTNMISNDGKYLVNQEKTKDGNAKNVGIAIVDQVNKDIVNLSTGHSVKLADNKAVAKFYAQYYKSGAAAADAGKVSTMVTYNISYL